MNTWLTAIIPDMLRHMAENGQSYPFDCENRWQWYDILHEIARKIEQYDGEDVYKRNEFYDEWQKNIGTDHVDEDLQKAYYHRQEQLRKETKQKLKDGFMMLVDRIDNLWD